MRLWQGQWQRHATRLGVALSLLLHGAALMVYLAVAEPPAALPAIRPFLVELVGPIASTAPATVGPPPPTAPDPSSPQATTPAPTPPTSAVAASPSPRGWFEANGLGAAPAARPIGPADLTARAPAALGLPGGSGGDGSGQDATTATRVGTLLRQASGRARIRTSHHPAWTPLSEKLRAHFQPDWSLLEQGPQPKGLAATGLARMFPGYLKMAARFANSEPLSDADGVMGERTSEAGKVADRLAAAGGQSSTGLSPTVERGENPFQRTSVTLVEVLHRDDGSVADIRLRQPCGIGAVDRLALAATRRAVAESDPTAWSRMARTSVWSFTATFGVLPPAPALACPIDVAWTGRFERCAYPLKKAAEGTVELEALE